MMFARNSTTLTHTDHQSSAGAALRHAVSGGVAVAPTRRSFLFGAAGVAGIALAGIPRISEASVRPSSHGKLWYAGRPKPGRLLCGVKVDDNGNDPSGIESRLGFADGLHRSYFVPGQEAALVARAALDLSKGRLPWVSMHVPASWQDMADGKQDAWLATMIAPLKGLAGSVWFTLHHEPWDNQGAGCTPASFVAMNRHVYPMTKGSTIAFVPVLQSWPFYTWVQGRSNVLDWCDPHACDVLGLDAYNQWYVGAKDSAWKTPAQTLDVATQLAAAYPTKPIAYGEWGVRTDPRTPGKAATWMHNFYDQALTTNVAGLCYYSSGLNSPNGPWVLDGERLTAFDELVHDARTARPRL